MREVKERAYGYDRLSLPDPKRYQEKSPQYWAGWSLAHYQWSSARGFAAILQHVSFSDIVDMYGVFHEMDVERFIEEMDRRIAAADGPCNLKRQRENAGLSQSELARLSGVGLRSIQMYEQRVNDINRAQAQTVLQLARAIGCSIEDLLE